MARHLLAGITLILLMVSVVSAATPSPVGAFTVVQYQGMNLKATYTEPTTNADGSKLTDLAGIAFYYDKAGTETLIFIAPASAPTGGASLVSAFPVPQGATGSIKVWAKAQDIAGNLSAAGPSITVTFDTMAPAPPQ